MGKTDKTWRLAANKNYRGKITMMEVKVAFREFNKDKNVVKPETIVDNSGKFEYAVSGQDLMDGKVMNIKVNKGGKAEVEANKKIKKAQVDDNIK